MPPGGKTGGNNKVAVGSSGPSNGNRIRLHTVNIQGDNLLTGTGKGIRDGDYVRTAIAGHAGRQVIARSQGKGDNLDTRKGLFGLCLARFRIGRAGFHKYVSGPEHKILAQVKGINAAGHVMDGFRIDGLGTALGLNDNGRLLPGSHTLVITGRVLVVIEPGQNSAVTLLDYGMVDTGCKNDLGGVTAFTATAGTAGKFSAGNLGTRLVP